MIVYTVHEPGIPAKSLDERADEVVFVKEGFTWWGFLFAPLLAALQRAVVRIRGRGTACRGGHFCVDAA